MSEELSRWLQDLSQGEERAAQQLWERYFDKLVRLARRKMEGLSLRSADEEDIALSAMNSFCCGLAAHRFDEIAGADELWKLLVTITARKVCAQRRKHFAQKRGGGRVRGESIFDAGGDCGIGEVLGNEPTPELAVGFAENCREMIDALGDETLQKIVVLALEGYRTPEIAEKLGCVRRTVERKLQIIREKWGQQEK
ncbi:MAG: ECF-type sigma factor [Planctomycetaceae bacterium]|nr:ECF-type sigma factor [Planctomycetaceae bacterium]